MMTYCYPFNEVDLSTTTNYLTKEDERSNEELFSKLQTALKQYEAASDNEKGYFKVEVFRYIGQVNTNHARNSKINRHESFITALCKDLTTNMPSGYFTTINEMMRYIYENYPHFCNTKTITDKYGNECKYPKRPLGLATATLERMVKEGNMMRVYDKCGEGYYIMK